MKFHFTKGNAYPGFFPTFVVGRAETGIVKMKEPKALKRVVLYPLKS